MSEPRHRFRLGLFVLCTLLLLAGLVVLFGGAPGWFTPRNEYIFVFTDAPGITQGSPIRKSGVKIGEVSAIELDNETGLVRITAKLNPKFQPRTNEKPVITRGLIVGDTSIDFVPENPDKLERGVPLPPGSEIVGVAPINPRSLITQASDVVPEAQRSLEQFRKSLESIEKAAPQLQATMKEFSELARAGREAIPELRRTNDAIRDFFRDDGHVAARAPVPPILGDEEGVEKQDQAALLQPKADPKADPKGDPDAAARNELRTILRDIRELGPEIRKTSQEMRFFLRTASFWTDEAGVMLLKTQPKIDKAIDSFNKTADGLNELLSPENRKAISDTLKNVQSATAGVNEILSPENRKTATATLKNIQNVTSSVNELLSADNRKAFSEILKNLQGTTAGLNDVFSPENRKSMAEMLKNLQGTTASLSELFSPENRKMITDTLKTVQTATADLLSAENRKLVTDTLKNVQNATGKFDRVTGAAEDLMKDGKVTLKNVNSALGKAESAIDDIRQVTKPLAESMPRLIRNLDTGIDQLTKTAADVNELVKAIGKAEGTFQKFIADPSLYNNLNTTICNVAKLTPRIDQILRDVEVFADKIARHPESIGVGGAVRPSSGIKEAPASLVPRPRMP